MNVKRLHQKFAPLGTISRKTFDLATGELSANSSVTVNISLLSRERPDGLTDSLPVTPARVRISKDLLSATGFAIPPQDGDVVAVAGIRAAIRTVLERSFQGQVVYVCRIEMVNG